MTQPQRIDDEPSLLRGDPTTSAGFERKSL